MMMTQTKTNILDGNSLDIYPACPRTDYLYWVNTQSNYGIYEWKITGGSFKYMGQTVKEIRSFNASSVTVVWDNVKSINGKAPEGKITLKIYGKHGHDQIVANGNRSQIIKSLNDIIPSNLISNAPLTTVIPRGKQDVKVYLEKPLNYPGIKLPNGMPYVVNKYEWRIPVGWRPKTGEAPSSNNTYFTISPVIDLLTNEDTGGDVTVRGVNDCTGSEDFSVYSYPITFTRSGLVLGDFPTNIPLGEVETNVFTVIAPNPGTFEWRAPEKWKINNRENIHIAGNVVYITNGACYTDEKVKVGLYQDGEVSSLTEFPTSNCLIS